MAAKGRVLSCFVIGGDRPSATVFGIEFDADGESGSSNPPNRRRRIFACSKELRLWVAELRKCSVEARKWICLIGAGAIASQVANPELPHALGSIGHWVMSILR